MPADPSTEQRVAQLRAELNRHNYLYYVKDAPQISDADYDALIRELRAIEAQHPELLTPDSPTQRVGAPPAKEFSEVRHSLPMLSLANAFDFDDLRAWYKRALALAERPSLEMVCELKIDGLAMALRYDDGVLTMGATRGDGERGEEVTQNLRTVRAVPLRLPEGSPDVVEVRGEVYLSKSEFARINRERETEGLPLYANPRNTAAGSVRQLDSRITASRRMHMFTYGLGEIEGAEPPSTHWEVMSWLESLGFRVNPDRRLCTTLDEVEAFCTLWLNHHRDLPYATDGIVVKVNDRSLWGQLGVVGREPRYAIAYKWPAEQATTKLNDIGINVGRTGKLNPFAVLEPVQVSGVTVKLATMHNEDYIRTKDLRIGDWVVVERAGEVIPQVVRSLPERRTGGEREFRMPAQCPTCKGDIVRLPNESDHRCTNTACPAQFYERLKHFVGVMEIEGLGERWSAVLIENGLVNSLDNIYRLTKDQLLALDRMGDKLATKVLSQIVVSKTRPLNRLVFALGIFHVGWEVAGLLARHFGTMDALMAASEEQLQGVAGIGPVIAKSVATFFADDANKALVGRLKDLGMRMTADVEAPTNGPLSGKAFCFTGTMTSMPRTEGEAKVKALGATASDNVTRKTTYLVIGADPGGTKTVAAQKYGTTVLNEEQFLELLRGIETAEAPGKGQLPLA